MHPNHFKHEPKLRHLTRVRRQCMFLLSPVLRVGLTGCQPSPNLHQLLLQRRKPRLRLLFQARRPQQPPHHLLESQLNPPHHHGRRDPSWWQPRYRIIILPPMMKLLLQSPNLPRRNPKLQEKRLPVPHQRLLLIMMKRVIWRLSKRCSILQPEHYANWLKRPNAGQGCAETPKKKGMSSFFFLSFSFSFCAYFELSVSLLSANM